MYTPAELAKTVFFDLETASEYESLDQLALNKPKMAELWSKRCEYLRSRFEENRDMTDEQLYEAKAALTPEFARIVCATFGRLNFIGEDPNVIIKSYCSGHEDEVLDGIQKVFDKFSSLKFSGHNIKRFDIPMMCKRLLIHGRSLPKGLQIQNLKPWEMPFIDTSELWSFGAWQEGFVSLELLVTSIGLETPKGDIKGEEVSRVFWQDGDTQRIAEYCQRDVFAGIQTLLKLSNLSVVEEFETQP
ncbi:Predicted 3'-5' exonuclease, PolB-like [uncultured Caudovirales phage]|uniref:Predicted 3'-5' exonuclease, PolB-like n=1 Tax=uncultured Caudovirales phage TaxID=2100421 RepID=A0A6J5PYM9_9CAUD|nr:Predicted 3'-5' exonuclease, PolB-like [uncultured Caudovirales phage]